MKAMRKLSLLATLTLSGQGFTAGPPTSLSASVQSAMQALAPKGSRWGISILEVETGRELVQLQGNLPLLPASNQKLVTTGASLVSLGTNFRFRTRLERREATGGGTVLSVVGDGDPAFADPDLASEVTWTAPDGSLRRGLDASDISDLWVRSARASGIRAVDTVVVDDRVFDREWYHPSWPRDQYAESYCAEVWGFNFHHNLLQVWPVPRPGAAADTSRRSPDLPWLKGENRTTSRTAENAPHSFWIGRPFGTNALTWNGNVRVAPRDPVAITLHDSPALFARFLAGRLESAGLPVGAYRVAADDDPRESGSTIGPPVETPLFTALLRCNTDSDNLYAESLFKRIDHAETGRPGSWSSGSNSLASVVARRLEQSVPDGVVFADGSGLSRGNRVTASLLTRWIGSILTDPDLADPFRESLAVGGKTGTVRNRFKTLAATGCTVECKTGYIRGVSCLSGVVTSPDGRQVAFSVLGNDLTAPDAIGKAKQLQERIVLAIAEDLRRRRPALGGG